MLLVEFVLKSKFKL